MPGNICYYVMPDSLSRCESLTTMITLHLININFTVITAVDRLNVVFVSGFNYLYAWVRGMYTSQQLKSAHPHTWYSPYSMARHDTYADWLLTLETLCLPNLNPNL